MPRAMSAIVLAILVYALTLNQTNIVSQWQTSFTVPVALVNLPYGLVATQQPTPVHVNLHATQQAYSQLQPNAFSAEIDASHAAVGDNQLPVVVRTTDPNVSDVSADVPEM